MAAILQPQILNDNGIILTIGIVANSDRMAIVMPIGTDDNTFTDWSRSYDACQSFENNVLTQFLQCLATTAEVRSIQAEGMVDGIVPARFDYAAGTNPGTGGSSDLPSNVTGLITYYEDPRDIAAGKKMRTAHTFMPGVASTDVNGDIVSSALRGKYDTFAGLCQNGWATVGATKKWYRFLSAPWQLTANPNPPPAMIRTRPRGVNIPRIVSWTVRSYVGTQRRRLVPHQ